MKAEFSNWNDRKDLGKQKIMISIGKRSRHWGYSLQACHGSSATAPLHPESDSKNNAMESQTFWIMIESHFLGFLIQTSFS